MNSTTPLWILLFAVVAATAAGLVWKFRQGRIRYVSQSQSTTFPLKQQLLPLGIGQGKPVILHFSAPWCAPCRAARTVIQSVLADTSGLEIELDLDQNNQLAQDLHVLSLPTTLVFASEGDLVARISGVPQHHALREALTQTSP